jgi:hypothetical protein
MNKNLVNEITSKFVESNYTNLTTFTKFLIQIKVRIDKHSMLHGRSHLFASKFYIVFNILHIDLKESSILVQNHPKIWKEYSNI